MSESSSRSPLTASNFVATTAAAVFVLALAGALLNWRINFYGLYGDVRGDVRIIATNDRWSKYLYAFNQLPSNYDALLVGSSLSANLDTAGVRAFKMYNLSMTGANVAEEQVLLDNALQHGHYGLIVFCLYPYMLKDHALKAGRVEPRDYWAGLGSLPLLEDYLVSGALRLHVFAPRFTASGSQDMDTSGAQPIGADTALRLLLSQTSGHPTVDVDPLAFDQLRALVSSARSSGSTVAAYFPPVYLPRYEAMRVGYEAFRAQMLTLFAPGEAIIDLNDGTFSGFSAEPRNFLDGSHYSHRGAALVSKAFADRLAGALGALPRSKLGR